MKNKAKCKLCESTIESYTVNDYVECKCGEIAVCGGSYKYEVYAKNFDNFLRIDELGNIFPITVKQITEISTDEKKEENEAHTDTTQEDTQQKEKKTLYESTATKQEVIEMLQELNSRIENLPTEARLQPINHYDFQSILLLLISLARAKD